MASNPKPNYCFCIYDQPKNVITPLLEKQSFADLNAHSIGNGYAYLHPEQLNSAGIDILKNCKLPNAKSVFFFPLSDKGKKEIEKRWGAGKTRYWQPRK